MLVLHIWELNINVTDDILLHFRLLLNIMFLRSTHWLWEAAIHSFSLLWSLAEFSELIYSLPDFPHFSDLVHTHCGSAINFHLGRNYL